VSIRVLESTVYPDDPALMRKVIVPEITVQKVGPTSTGVGSAAGMQVDSLTGSARFWITSAEGRHIWSAP
jgi:hypothetical protein